MSRKSEKKSERRRKQKLKARFEATLSNLDVRISMGYFTCPKQGHKRPVGACKWCKTKRCTYKKAMQYFWKKWIASNVPGGVTPPPTKIIRKTELKFSKSRKKWFRVVYYTNGDTHLEEAPAGYQHMRPSDWDSVDGLDDDEGVVTKSEPFSIFLKDGEDI